jgi:hypothetical protein
MSREEGTAERRRETAVAVVSRGDDGIVVLRFGHRIWLKEAETREVLEAHIEIAGDEARPTLADIRGLRGADQHARRLPATPEATAAMSHLAVLVGNPVTRVLASFFIRVTGPKFPARVFSDEAAAREWLASVRDQDSE